MFTVQIGVYTKIRVINFGKISLERVAVARFGLKLRGNEATRFRIMFKPDVLLKIFIKVGNGGPPLFLPDLYAHF